MLLPIRHLRRKKGGKTGLKLRLSLKIPFNRNKEVEIRIYHPMCGRCGLQIRASPCAGGVDFKSGPAKPDTVSYRFSIYTSSCVANGLRRWRTKTRYTLWE